MKFTEKTLEKLTRGVRDMDEDLVKEAAEEVLASSLDPLLAINEGLTKGMTEAGRLYEEEQYFIPELLLCSDALYEGLSILMPHIEKKEGSSSINVVIGVVQGDTHDIGKNLVKIMLDVSGFEVFDLGRNVPLRSFVEKVKEVNAELLCLSTLLSTTMDGMEKIINMLINEGIREKVTVMVGGGPVSKGYADSIGADGYAENANGAVKVAKELLSRKGVLELG